MIIVKWMQNVFFPRFACIYGKNVVPLWRKIEKNKNVMPEILFQPRTNLQLAWLIGQAKEHGIPYREFVKPSSTHNSKKAEQLADFAVAGKHARMIAAGKMKGCDAYGLLDEL